MSAGGDAASLSAHRPAMIPRRIGAYLIDVAVATGVLLISAGIFGGISFATQGGFPLALAGVCAYLLLAGWLVVYTLMQGGAGSLGMRATGLRLAPADGTDAPLGFGRALLRNVIWAVAGSVVVGYFSPLFDSSPWHRGWHDLVGGAVMTDIAGRGPAVVTDTPATTSDEDASASRPASPAPAAPPSLPLSVAPSLPTPPRPPLPPQAPSAPAEIARHDDTELAAIASAPRGAAPPAPNAGLISFVPGISAPAPASSPAPAGPPTPPTAPAFRGVVRDEDVFDDPDDTRLSAPAAVDETLLTPPRRARARLVWDDGHTHAVYGRTVFGRNPAPEPGALVHPVRDETLSLSKTHFEVVPGDAGELWVTDRASTNGVTIRRGTQRQTITSGEPTRLQWNDVLEFGDRWARVEPAP